MNYTAYPGDINPGSGPIRIPWQSHPQVIVSHGYRPSYSHHTAQIMPRITIVNPPSRQSVGNTSHVLVVSRSDEVAARSRLADSQLGGVIGFYRQHAQDDVSTADAVRRWDAGVRCPNLSELERKIVDGHGWLVVCRGTDMAINGMDVRLNTD